jgi:hypothetical protein
MRVQEWKVTCVTEDGAHTVEMLLCAPCTYKDAIDEFLECHEDFTDPGFISITAVRRYRDDEENGDGLTLQ